MGSDFDDDLERVIRPFYEISQKGIIEGTLAKLDYGMKTNREQYILDRATQRLAMRRQLMTEYVKTQETRIGSMEALLRLKDKELRLQGELRHLLENGPTTPQIPGQPQKPHLPQASQPPMSVQVTEAQQKQDAARIAMGMGNIPDREAQITFLVEEEDSLMERGYSEDLAHRTIQKAVELATKA